MDVALSAVCNVTVDSFSPKIYDQSPSLNRRHSSWPVGGNKNVSVS